MSDLLSKIRLRFKCESFKLSEVITVLVRNGEASAYAFLDRIDANSSDINDVLVSNDKLKTGRWFQEHFGVQEDWSEPLTKDTKLKDIPLLYFVRFKDMDAWVKLDKRDEYPVVEFKRF